MENESPKYFSGRNCRRERRTDRTLRWSWADGEGERGERVDRGQSIFQGGNRTFNPASVRADSSITIGAARRGLRGHTETCVCGGSL